MELTNNIDKEISLASEINLDNQKNFLETNLGKVINIALDTGIRALLPDLIEEQIIDVKNALLNNGFKAGMDEAISSAIDFGKSTLGIFTGNFENVTQMRNAIKNGGILDGISNALDYTINICSNKGIIPLTITSLLKTGKNALLDNISSGIENEFDNQINSIEKLSKYSQNWKEYYNKKDFKGMEKEFDKIKKKLQETIPFESTIKEARTIENLHTLIKNKNGNFNISSEEMELVKKLII